METDPQKTNVNPDPVMQRKYNHRIAGAFSVLLGILACINGFIPCLWWISPVFGIPGIAAGVYSLIESRKAGVSTTFAYAGIILSLLGCLAFLIPSMILGQHKNAGG